MLYGGTLSSCCKYETSLRLMKRVSCLFSSFLGVIPSTDFLKASGVPLSNRGDVVVDKVGFNT